MCSRSIIDYREYVVVLKCYEDCANIIEYIIILIVQVTFTHVNSYPIVLLVYICTKKYNNDDGHIISQ